MTPLRIVRRIASTLVIGGHFTVDTLQGGTSMKTILVAAAVLMAMTAPAFAKHCPKDVKIIDQALPKATGLNETQIAEVKALRDKGAAFHKSKKHGEAIKALHAATKILGVKPYMPM